MAVLCFAPRTHHSCFRLSEWQGPAVWLPTARTQALCGAGAFGQWGGTEEPAALLLSDTLRSSYKWEHDAHVSDAVPTEEVGINYKHSAIQ